MKRKEKLNALKEEVETVSKKLHELSEEELAQVSGGARGIKTPIIDPTVINPTSTPDRITQNE